MTYRIDMRNDGTPLIEFQGLLDAPALETLARRAAAAGGAARLVLRQGTELDPTALDGLRRLPVASIAAESPFLSRLLEEPR